jgi:hypothetical protein
MTDKAFQSCFIRNVTCCTMKTVEEKEVSTRMAKRKTRRETGSEGINEVEEDATGELEVPGIVTNGSLQIISQQFGSLYFWKVEFGFWFASKTGFLSRHLESRPRVTQSEIT